MALPSTGSINMNQVNVELKKSDTSKIALNDTDVRKLANKPSGIIGMSDLRGKSAEPQPQDCDYYFETIEYFKARRDTILAENNNDLSQKTFGFGDGVTSLKDAFRGTSITSTPRVIIAKNVTDFSWCFCDCSSLTSIPNGLFDNCTKVTNFRECFKYCESLTTIPQGLFDNCHNVTVFSECFRACSRINVPYELFDNCHKVESFSGCFNNCIYTTSSLPDVWNKSKFPQVKYYEKYARNCTNATNYNEIPADFK